MRRIKRLQIAPAIFFRLFSAGDHAGYMVEQGIPTDAKLMNVRHGWPDMIELLIQSESFEEIKEGQEIPFLAPVVTDKV